MDKRDRKRGSWLCYYRALQIGEASKVVHVDKLSVVIILLLAFVFLHEEFTIKSLLGCFLIGAGTLIMVI
ncbi:MAG: EamA family transporter [Lachnospiraceae bacterium]|nr:EamA family transporter [Lachnospiraceae bacterium]